MTCPKCGGTRSTCYVCHGSAITADQMRYYTQGIDIRNWRTSNNYNIPDVSNLLNISTKAIFDAENGVGENDYVVKAIRRACE